MAAKLMSNDPSLGKAVVLTVSDSASARQREDLSGPEVRDILEETGFEVVEMIVVADELAAIQDTLRFACQLDEVRLVVTTGGTGLSPRDVTPEATRGVIHKEAPGMAELMRMEGLKNTPKAALSRGIVGVRDNTLIVNLPGSVKGVRESLGALTPVLPHAIQVIGQSSLECGE